jgi:hypothetical protein
MCPPEELRWGAGEDNPTWKAENFTSKEWDEKGGRDGCGGPKKKVGLPDQRKIAQAFRDNYEKTFGHK